MHKQLTFFTLLTNLFTISTSTRQHPFTSRPIPSWSCKQHKIPTDSSNKLRKHKDKSQYTKNLVRGYGKGIVRHLNGNRQEFGFSFPVTENKTTKGGKRKNW